MKSKPNKREHTNVRTAHNIAQNICDNLSS